MAATGQQLEVTQVKQYVGGDWVDGGDGRTFDAFDPYTGEVVVRAPAGTREDARRAIDAAAAAFPAWSKSPPVERQRLFLRAADVLESRHDEIAGLLMRESGAALSWARFQLGFTPGLLRQAAGMAYHPTGEVVPADLPGAFSMALRRPVGVVGAITPWNAALILSLRGIVAPIALGNTVVLKPSELAPYVGGLILGEIFEEAGFPAGVLNIVTHAPGEAEPIGDELVENRHVRRISFTGSTRTGRRIAEKAARHLKRVLLELGGYNPVIVLRDADVDYAVDASAFAAFLHQGQICMSARKILVERPVADEFVEKLVAKTATIKVGDPKDPETVVGPLITSEAVANVARRVDDAVAGGARVLVGGSADGPCYRPTLLTDVPPDSEFARHETFGPVAAIEVVDDADEAVERANATTYGLSAGILTRDPDKGLALAERLECGCVHVNDQSVHDEPQMPLGGMKDSGWGRFGGRAAVEEFTDLRWVTVQSGRRPFPF